MKLLIKVNRRLARPQANFHSTVWLTLWRLLDPQTAYCDREITEFICVFVPCVTYIKSKPKPNYSKHFQEYKFCIGCRCCCNYIQIMTCIGKYIRIILHHRPIFHFQRSVNHIPKSKRSGRIKRNRKTLNNEWEINLSLQICFYFALKIKIPFFSTYFSVWSLWQFSSPAWLMAKMILPQQQS